MSIRTLIVDDEALARRRLRKLLADQQDLEIVGECGNGPEAVAFIKENGAQLMFLDVQMPEVNGFDVLRALPREAWPAVIFVTAHDQHAIQAFDVHALDYLLKPFTQERLIAAIQRARKHLQAQDMASLNQQLSELLKPHRPAPAYLSRIAVKTGSQTLYVRVEDIDYIESAANYAVLKTRGESHIVRETLTNLESKLSPRNFLRISRSIIVNLDRIKGTQSSPRGEYLVLLQDGRQLLMTRGAREVQERLQYAGTKSALSAAQS